MNLHEIPASRRPGMTFPRSEAELRARNEADLFTNEAMLRAERRTAEAAAMFTADDIRRLQNQILGTWNEPNARTADPLRDATPVTRAPVVQETVRPVARFEDPLAPVRHDPTYWGVYDRPVVRAPVEPPVRTSNQILEEIACLSYEVSRAHRGNLDSIRFAVRAQEMFNLQREIDQNGNIGRGGIITLYGIRLVVE